ncbi:copper resistance CopC family protein [Paractinoplanes hotanensis]|uniref:Copper resistance protein CopC n=1 Tax=Paractinoplanes hotanensis TaxID=2906497 RepID=A0ABT0XRH7_9ACTN|nr:copper resistance protein CopC [Actinoplanes hotanensis]MCM4076378.1 copper resistance protein CopC [Actinoplanes hotanensis]
MRRLLLSAAVFVAVLAPGAPAWAHAQLVKAVPARDAALPSAPTTVELTFSEDLNPEFTTIVVSDAARQRVPAAAPVVDGAAGTLALSRPLTDGAYTVAYRVVSADGHTVQGSYGFTVGEPIPAVAASAPGSGGLPPAVLIGLCGVGVVLAGVAVYLYLSGKRRRTINS